MRFSPRKSNYRTAALALMLVVLGGALAACDGGGDEGADATPSDATSTPTSGTTTPTPTTEGTPQPSAGAADGAYDSALQMLLEEDLGTEPSEDVLASFDIDVMADGTGLPEGSGVASAGQEIYAAQCATCHGEDGEGGGPAGDGPQLIIEDAGPWAPGAPKVVGNYWPYATTVFDYVRRAMPFNNPGSLSDEEVYAVVAYLLSENGVIEADEEMNAESLPAVQMPNRDNFFSCWPEECRPDVETGAAASEGEEPTETPDGEASPEAGPTELPEEYQPTSTPTPAGG